MRLLQVALVSATLHLWSCITRHILRVPHLVVSFPRLASIVRAMARHVVARVRRLTLEHVVGLIEARFRNVTSLVRRSVVL